MKKKNDWVPCFGEGCKTKINLNGSSIVDSFCMECREGRDTAPEKAHDPTPSQSIMPMKSKCCGAEVCRSHDGRSTFCMKCFADTTESETNHRAQVEDWAADFDSMFPQLAEETHDRGHNGNNREYYWKSRTDDVKEFITNLLKSEIEAARQDQKRIDAEKAIGIAEDEHGRDGDHPWCDSEDPCCMVEKLKQSIISTE